MAKSRFNICKGRFCGGARGRLRDWETDSRAILQRIRKKSEASGPGGRAATPWPTQGRAPAKPPEAAHGSVTSAGAGTVLANAVKQAKAGNCGSALENLGKAKILYGSQKRDPRVAFFIQAVERGCPKRVLAIRDDIAQALMPQSNAEKMREGLLMGKLRKPGRVWDPEWDAMRDPTEHELRVWKALKKRQKLVKALNKAAARGGRKHGGKVVYRPPRRRPQRWGPAYEVRVKGRRGGARRGAGRPKKE